jgi:hypothetical protein
VAGDQWVPIRSLGPRAGRSPQFDRLQASPPFFLILFLFFFSLFFCLMKMGLAFWENGCIVLPS